MTMAGLRAHCVICQGLLPPQPNSSNKDSSGDAAAELSYLRQAILHPPAVHVELPCGHSAHAACTASLAEAGAGACPVCGGAAVIYGTSRRRPTSVSSSSSSSRLSKSDEEAVRAFRECCCVYVKVQQRVRRGELASWAPTHHPAPLRMEYNAALATLRELAQEGNAAEDEEEHEGEEDDGEDGSSGDAEGGRRDRYELQTLLSLGGGGWRGRRGLGSEKEAVGRAVTEAVDEASVAALAQLLLGGILERGEGAGCASLAAPRNEGGAVATDAVRPPVLQSRQVPLRYLFFPDLYHIPRRRAE